MPVMRRIHLVTIEHLEDVTIDAQGVPTEVRTEEQHWGFAALLSAQEQAAAQSRGRVLSCVVQVPPVASVTVHDKVTISKTNHLGLDGTYYVDEVRGNQWVKRLMLRLPDRDEGNG